MNIKETLTQEDYKRWAINFFMFSAPAIAIFFMSFGTGDFRFAWGAFTQALAAAILDLYGKYKAGVDPKDFPTGTKTVIEATEDAIVTERTGTQKVVDILQTKEENPVDPKLTDL